MSIRSLLAARVDLTLRGLISRDIAEGASVEDGRTARRAAAVYLGRQDRTTERLRADVHQLAREALASLRAGRRMNEGGELADGRSVPLTASAARAAGERYRYFGIIVVDDPASGGQQRVPVEVTSSTALTNDEVRQRLAGAYSSAHFDREYRTSTGTWVAPSINSIVIVSVDRSS